jgi:hypothetical protein
MASFGPRPRPGKPSSSKGPWGVKGGHSSPREARSDVRSCVQSLTRAIRAAPGAIGCREEGGGPRDPFETALTRMGRTANRVAGSHHALSSTSRSYLAMQHGGLWRADAVESPLLSGWRYRTSRCRGQGNSGLCFQRAAPREPAGICQPRGSTCTRRNTRVKSVSLGLPNCPQYCQRSPLVTPKVTAGRCSAGALAHALGGLRAQRGTWEYLGGLL